MHISVVAPEGSVGFRINKTQTLRLLKPSNAQTSSGEVPSAKSGCDIQSPEILTTTIEPVGLASSHTGGHTIRGFTFGKVLLGKINIVWSPCVLCTCQIYNTRQVAARHPPLLSVHLILQAHYYHIYSPQSKLFQHAVFCSFRHPFRSLYVFSTHHLSRR